MTSTSTKLSSLIIISLFIISFSTAEHYYNDNSGIMETGDSEFSIPEYESHQEVIFQLVIPFILVFSILSFIMEKVLAYTFAEDDDLGFLRDKSSERKRIKKYGIIISLTITGMMVPSPLWDYVIYAAQFVGAMGMLAFVGLFLFTLYLFSGA